MKKLLYTFLFLAFSGLAITSCTEEEVSPNTTQQSNGGGNGTSDVIKR
jgi:hypothetical protein